MGDGAFIFQVLREMVLALCTITPEEGREKQINNNDVKQASTYVQTVWHACPVRYVRQKSELNGKSIE